MSGDWHDSLFNSEKGDSLGDGTWGRPEPDDALAPVAWDKLPDAPSKKQRPRARLATPAPGSQAESGLLDIKALAGDLAASMKNQPSLAQPKRPTPPGREVKAAARLATEARGSTGSGLIDFSELVRAQEQAAAAAEAEADADDGAGESASESGASVQAAQSGAGLSSSASGSASPTAASSGADPTVDDDDAVADVVGANRSTLIWLVGVLTLAFIGLAAYVLTR